MQVKTIREQCQKMGAGDMYPLLAAMLTARPWNKIIDPHLDSLQVCAHPTPYALCFVCANPTPTLQPHLDSLQEPLCHRVCV